MLTQIQPFDDFDCFPPLDKAAAEPNGLLAIGGDLQAGRLIAAYRRGIFPWFNDGQPILWWSPDPRMVLFPAKFHCSRSLRKSLKKAGFEVSFNQAFERVIQACSAPREYSRDTWITSEMKVAYGILHQQGYAHSVEIWQQDKLVGGLYGITIGKVFFGESMFSLQTDASKIAFMVLAKHLNDNQFAVIDCQVYSEHLQTLGAESISRDTFEQLLKMHIKEQPSPLTWPAGRQAVIDFVT